MLLAVSSPAAAGPGDQVCEDLDSGKIDVQGSETTIVITAPDGMLITEYCVKAGSIEQDEGPEYVTVDPPAAQVTISHSSGKDISHYSFAYESGTTTTSDETTTTTTTTTTTLPGETTTTKPGTTHPTTVTTGTLPSTGPDRTDMTSIVAGLLVLAGASALLVARRH